MKLSFAFLSVLLGLGFGQAVHASAPQIRKQAPGYYRFMVGDTEVTALLDGTFPMKTNEVLTTVKPADLAKTLAKSFQGTAVTTSVNGYLVNTGTKLVLIDTGAGTFMGPSAGHFLENFKASGYSPEQVDEIYLTHMHSDHLGGLTTDGKRNFPQATLRTEKREGDFWLNAAEAEKATHPMMKAMFANAKTILGAYETANKFATFDGETELVPGVHAHPAYGHTAGHTVYTVESKNEKLWLFGDLIHVAAYQFPNPKTPVMFDWNAKLAVAERMKDFTQAAKAGDMVAAAHLSFPGVGHLAKTGTGFNFVPLTYSPVADVSIAKLQ